MPKDNIEGTVTKLDGLQGLDADAVKKDQEFKSLFKYKSVAAMLLKYAVPDFEKYTLQEIADSILDIQPRSPANDAERYHGEIDLLNEEIGNTGEKLIRMDMVFSMRFEVRLPDSEKIDFVNFTIDFEMQGDKPTEYKIVTRGIYYGASLLRDTLKYADKYAGIHKVYSIWLCNFEVLEEAERSKRYVHSYNMIRNYREKSRHRYKKDSVADLVEVTFVELTKVTEHLKRDELAQFLDAVFNDIGGLSKLMEKKLGVAIGGTGLEEGVNEVIDMTKYGDIREAQGEQKGELKGERKKATEMATEMLLDGEPIDKIMKYTKLTEKQIKEIKI